MVSQAAIEIDREANGPLYLQLQNAIKANVDSGKWPPGFRLPTYKELVKITGVSLITVQQAIDNLEREGILYRRQGIGTFVATPETRRRSMKIGLFLTELRHPFFSGLAEVIQSEAIKHSYTVAFFSLNDERPQILKAANLLAERNVDGIITTPASHDALFFQLLELRKRGVPVVIVDGHLEGEEIDCVQTDNRKGMALVLDHLIDLGHRRIAFASSQCITQGVRERMQAFQEILQERNLPLVPSLIQVSHLHEDEGGWDAGHKLLALREPPTAIACANDMRAVGVMRAAKELGIAVPEQLSVAGFDDLDLSSHLEVPLTTVRQPVKGIGKLAFDLLLKQMRGQGTTKGESHFLNPDLVLRSSTAKPPHT